MSRRKAACGTMMPKVVGQDVKIPDLASYARLRPLIDGAGQDRAPDPMLFARVIMILRDIEVLLRVKPAMQESHALRLSRAAKIEALKAKLRDAVLQDRTGQIHAALLRAQGNLAIVEADNG